MVGGSRGTGVAGGRNWKARTDPLYRGDSAGGVALPTPTADSSIVRHVLYLDGLGRETPYSSTTESHDVAVRFAGSRGAVWETKVQKAEDRGVQHISRKTMLDLLKGKGKGDAAWPSAFEVLQARKYIEESNEHLLDFRSHDGSSSEDLEAVVNKLFQRVR